MLEAFGWCVLRSSRAAYKDAKLEHGGELDEVDAAVDAADREVWAAFREWEAADEDVRAGWLRCHFHEHMNNIAGVLLIAASSNHRASSLWSLLDWISVRAAGSYGLVHVRDDEDRRVGADGLALGNAFRVFRILNGAVEEFGDAHLSPFVPFVSPTELA